MRVTVVLVTTMKQEPMFCYRQFGAPLHPELSVWNRSQKAPTESVVSSPIGSFPIGFSENAVLPPTLIRRKTRKADRKALTASQAVSVG